MSICKVHVKRRVTCQQISSWDKIDNALGDIECERKWAWWWQRQTKKVIGDRDDALHCSPIYHCLPDDISSQDNGENPFVPRYEYGRVVTWTDCHYKQRQVNDQADQWKSALPRLRLITDRQSELQCQSNYHGKGRHCYWDSPLILLSCLLSTVFPHIQHRQWGICTVVIETHMYTELSNERSTSLPMIHRQSLSVWRKKEEAHRRNLSISKYVAKNIAHVVDQKSVSLVSTLVLYMIRKWPSRAQSLVIKWKANQKWIMWGTGALKVSLSKLSRHHRLSQQHQFPYLGNVILRSPVSSFSNL